MTSPCSHCAGMLEVVRNSFLSSLLSSFSLLPCTSASIFLSKISWGFSFLFCFHNLFLFSTRRFPLDLMLHPSLHVYRTCIPNSCSHCHLVIMYHKICYRFLLLLGVCLCRNTHTHTHTLTQRVVYVNKSIKQHL